MKYYFAPLEGITNYTFRRTHHHFFPGMDRYYTPFLVTNQNFKFKNKEIREILPENNKDIHLIPQVLTNSAEQMVWAVGEIASFGYEEVNLNLGCPSGTVVSRHKGAGMLQDPQELDPFFEEVFDGLEKQKVRTDISVKTRLGLQKPEEFPALMDIFNRYPLSGIIIHPRVREEYYKGSVHMENFAAAFQKSLHPVCYNGDLKTPADVQNTAERFPGLDAVMIGRGLIRNPSLVRQVQTGREITLQELLNFLDALYDSYSQEISGEYNVICKMKEIWAYVSDCFPGCEKGMKRIRKARRREQYRDGVREIVESCPFKP